MFIYKGDNTCVIKIPVPAHRVDLRCLVFRASSLAGADAAIDCHSSKSRSTWRSDSHCPLNLRISGFGTPRSQNRTYASAQSTVIATTFAPQNESFTSSTCGPICQYWPAQGNE